jgi:hypothetical protein
MEDWTMNQHDMQQQHIRMTGERLERNSEEKGFVEIDTCRYWFIDKTG